MKDSREVILTGRFKRSHPEAIEKRTARLSKSNRLRIYGLKRNYPARKGDYLLPNFKDYYRQVNK